MKRQRFIEIFQQNLTHTLTQHRESTALLPSVPLCITALETATLGEIEITQKNLPSIQAKFSKAIDALAEESKIRGKSAHYAKKTFEDVRLEPATRAGVQPTLVPQFQVTPAPQTTSAPAHISAAPINDDTQFFPNDYIYDTKVYSEKQIQMLNTLENCCAYPKLALVLGGDSKVINDYLRDLKKPADTVLTPRMIQDYRKNKQKPLSF